MEDVLRMAGPYEYLKFEKAAKDYCSTKYETLKRWYDENLYPKATLDRFRCVSVSLFSHEATVLYPQRASVDYFLADLQVAMFQVCMDDNCSP